jgi:large repetitive protein
MWLNNSLKSLKLGIVRASIFTPFLRYFLSGILLWLCTAQIAMANLVLNPFFAGSATVATDWPSSSAGIGAAFNSNTRPVPAAVTAAGGSTEFYSGCVGQACTTFPLVIGSTSGAQQNVPTVIGTSYSLSFWVYHSGTGTGLVTGNSATQVDVYWGSNRVYNGFNVPTAGWSLQTIDLGPATSSSTTLTVMIRDDPSYSAITFMSIKPIVLKLSKANPSSLAVGSAANYSFTINNVSSQASDASFTLLDQLPPNVQYNSVAAGTGLTGASCVASGTVAAGQLLTCTITRASGIPAGGAASLTINVTPQAGASGVPSVNRASVPFSGTGVGTSPSSCVADNQPLGCAVASSVTPNSVNLTKANPTIFAVGAAANYNLVITNNMSTATAASFTLQDKLPANIQFNSSAVVAGLTGASCVASGTVAAGQLLTCAITTASGILAGASGSLNINVTPQAAAAGVSASNLASVPSNGTGTGVAPTTCTANGTPAGCAVAAAIAPSVLSLSKANPASFQVGVAANYSLTISNNGALPSGASFTLLDQLPPNIQFNSSTAGAGLTGASCSASGTVLAGQLLTCTITSAAGIPGGGNGVLTINVTPQAASANVAGINRASVPISGSGVGVTPSTCTANGVPSGCAVAPQIVPTFLSLAKANPSSFQPGVAANYLLTISNGGGVASGTTFTLLDKLPPNFQFNSSAVGSGLTGATCVASGTVAAGQLLTCTITSAAGIPAGGSASLTINVTPQAAAAGISSSNTATIPASGIGTGGLPYACVTNNSPLGCAVANPITPVAALVSVAKTAQLVCDPVNGLVNPKSIPGAVLRWTITVTNTGATAVDLTTLGDTIGALTTFEPNLVTGAGSTPSIGCSSSTGTPESAAGRGFKLAISGTPVSPATSLRPLASYPKFFTSTAADTDGASFSTGALTVNFASALPAEGTAPNAYTAGQLKPGETVVVYFNVTVN